MGAKRYRRDNVLEAAKSRISETFDSVERVYCAFSGGKDSSVLLHLVMAEAIKRGRKVAVMYIDFEAQYAETIAHVEEMFELYAPHIEQHWICMPMLLRNAVTNYEPRWICWDESKKDIWIRQKPEKYNDHNDYPFAQPEMEFEEFVALFGEWYSQGKPTAGFIGIRAQESLHRYCAIATWEKRDAMLNGRRWTTKIAPNTYNVYPIYDWLSEDIWRYHARHPDKPHNKIYDKMQMAGVPLKQQRLCQPFGDDQRRGLWLYHILEPETWSKLVVRVNGANSGALYIEETGNINGVNKVTKPPGHTWKSFCNLLLQTLPKKTRDHYIYRFKKFIFGWKNRGYTSIPDEAPIQLETKCWAPSWRRMCRVLLRNDYWCKGLGQTQPKSEAYQRYKQLKAQGKLGTKNTTKVSDLTMKFTASPKAIVDAIKRIMPAISRTTLPVLSNVLIVAGKDSVQFTGSNCDQWICVEVSAEVDKQGKTTVPVRKFLAAISSMSEAASVLVSADNKESVTITGGTRKTVLAGITAEEFPKIVSAENGAKITFELDQLIGWLKAMSPFQSIEVARPQLCGVHLVCDGKKATFHASDGRRLLQIETDVFAQALDCIIPSQSVSAVIGVATGEDVALAISEDAAVFSGTGWVMATKLLNLVYPNIAAAMPDFRNYKDRATANRESLISALEYTSNFCPEKTPEVTLKTEGNELVVTGKNTGVSDSEERIASTGEIGFMCNPKFFIDSLKAFETENVEIIGGNKGLEAIVIQHNSITSVLMPLRRDAPATAK